MGRVGPALLLLPGTLGRADIFWQQIDALRGQVQILALSYPDTGGIEDWSVDIDVMLADHGFSSVTVLGSSLGGYLAQYFAATRPAGVSRLVAANTLSDLTLLAHSAPYNTDIDALPETDLMTGFTANLQALKAVEPDLAGLLLAEVEGRIPLAELRNRLKALQAGPTLPCQSLDSGKVFTVESDDDQLIPEPVRMAVRAALKPARAYVFENGTHFPYVTQPQKYTAMLAEILEV
jgi:pimeloyl-ACP methyl ester carboxylesterase